MERAAKLVTEYDYSECTVQIFKYGPNDYGYRILHCGEVLDCGDTTPIKSYLMAQALANGQVEFQLL